MSITAPDIQHVDEETKKFHAGLGENLNQAGFNTPTNPEDNSTLHQIKDTLGDSATYVVGSIQETVSGGEEERRIGVDETGGHDLRKILAEKMRKIPLIGKSNK